MPSEITARIRRHAARRPLGTLLVVGTAETSVEELLAASPERLILVEPNPDLWPALEEAARSKGAELWKGAPAAVAGEAPFYRYNVPRLSSLHPPSEALLRLFPGLRQSGSAMVPTFPLSSLLEPASLSADALNVLIINSPGAEEAIVRALLDSQLHGLFGLLVLHAAADSFYEGAGSPREAMRQLERRGFRLEDLDEGDPDFPVAWLRLDPLALEVQQLREDLTGERARSAGLEREKARLDAERQAEQEKAQALVEESETLSRRLEELQEQAAALERDTRAEKATMEEQRLELRAQTEVLAQLRERLAHLESELEQERSLRQQLDTEFTRAQAQMDLLREFLDLRPAPLGRRTSVPALMQESGDPQ